MTSKLTREENVQAVFDLKAGYTLGLADVEILKRVARMALAAMDSEPVAWTDEEELRDVNVAGIGYLFGIDREANKFADPRRQIMLYRHAQLSPVVMDDIKLRELFDSWFASDCSFDLSPEASEADNIAWRESYWYVWQRCSAAMLQENPKSAGESNNCRSSENVQDLLAGNCRENANSSTNNCREIAGTSTGAAITPAAPDKKLTDDVLDEIIAGAKTSMEQYLALSLKAEREVWRKEGPTDDERIMAIEGIHNCERCGDEGWVVGEMGITRCACGQAGNSPVHSGLRPEQGSSSPAPSPSREHFISLCNEFWNWSEMDLVCADDRGYELRMEWDGKVFKHPVTQALWRMYQAAPSGIQMIPDGYVMVPKEPTERMVIAGFESEPDEGFSELQVWEAYEDMSGCEQAAYLARLCWAAMLAAAPQEVQGEHRIRDEMDMGARITSHRFKV